MAVCTENNVSRFNVTGLCHQLMADTITSVDVRHAVFGCKCITDTKMPCIIQLAGRNQMVIDQNHFFRIIEFCKTHFFKFFCYKRNKNIMNHDAVYIHCDDIARFDIFSCIMSDNLFNNCLAHCLLLSLNPIRSAFAWHLQGRLPE